ncbi:hypothetical protein GPECTOR_2g1115 [Gonium pectorale]|uniref:RRM domain-containing protein n=1 Tax=Gonium pectorale TaxID=33097 RepID=A0A150H072_GONPE|nr:hypothetical protein GPECTOR_2g1115 [Gonium pectorale]|eukprot:KXZ55566.1 hypothetical protein GPECTOR_2g1115 [Gonium pectorale]
MALLGFNVYRNFEYDAEERDVIRLMEKYGFAFVYMRYKEDGDEAVRRLDRTECTKAKRVVPRWLQKSEADRKRDTRPSRTLFVVNFDVRRTTERDIDRFFSRYGRLLRVQIKKNYSFVQFADVESAIRALERTNGAQMDGRTLAVEYVQVTLAVAFPGTQPEPPAGPPRSVALTGPDPALAGAQPSAVPIKIPPGMPTAQAQALVAYLKSNPAAAKAAYEQAQMMMQNPAMAHAFTNMSAPQAPAMMERLNALKDDPELKDMFEDMKNNGADAFKKYWDDTELMLKISKKLRALDVSGQEGQAAPAAEGDASAPAPEKKLIANLHDAAKHGDVEAATRLIEEGADVNALSDKGISALGVAVGFNRLDVVKLLIAKGADLSFRDPKKNTIMHYAAGYGRMAIAKALLAAGAELAAENDAKQTPVAVAKLNGEREMVKFLEGKAASAVKSEAAAEPAATEATA